MPFQALGVSLNRLVAREYLLCSKMTDNREWLCARCCKTTAHAAWSLEGIVLILIELSADGDGLGIEPRAKSD